MKIPPSGWTGDHYDFFFTSTEKIYFLGRIVNVENEIKIT